MNSLFRDRKFYTPSIVPPAVIALIRIISTQTDSRDFITCMCRQTHPLYGRLLDQTNAKIGTDLCRNPLYFRYSNLLSEFVLNVNSL